MTHPRLTRDELERAVNLYVPESLRAEAIGDLVKGNVLGFLGKVGNTQALAAVMQNHSLFLRMGVYEKALLLAYMEKSSNHRTFPLAELRFLFGLANSKKMRVAGEPLPRRGPHTIYRGVSGAGRFRRVRGLSWTLSLNVAGSFANRLGLENPAVYQTVVPTRCVLAYLHEKGRKEEEVLVLLPSSARLKRVPESKWWPEKTEEAGNTDTPSSALEYFRRVMKEREARRNSASNR